MNAWTKSGLLGICWALVWYGIVLLVGDPIGKAMAIIAAGWCVPFLLLSLACGWLWQFARSDKGITWTAPIGISLAVYVALFSIIGHEIIGGNVVDLAIFPILLSLPSFLYLGLRGADPKTMKGPNQHLR